MNKGCYGGSVRVDKLFFVWGLGRSISGYLRIVVLWGCRFTSRSGARGMRLCSRGAAARGGRSVRVSLGLELTAGGRAAAASAAASPPPRAMCPRPSPQFTGNTRKHWALFLWFTLMWVKAGILFFNKSIYNTI